MNLCYRTFSFVCDGCLRYALSFRAAIRHLFYVVLRHYFTFFFCMLRCSKTALSKIMYFFKMGHNYTCSCCGMTALFCTLRYSIATVSIIVHIFKLRHDYPPFSLRGHTPLHSTLLFTDGNSAVGGGLSDPLARSF